MRTPRSRTSSKNAFSLVEILIAITIFAILALGLLSSLMQTRRITQTAVYKNVASTIAEGYIEQIKSMSFEDVPTGGGSILVPESGTLPSLLEISPIADIATAETPNPASDIQNSFGIDYLETPLDPSDDISMDVVLYIERLDDAAIEPSLIIALRYTYVYRDGTRTFATLPETYYAIRSNVRYK